MEKSAKIYVAGHRGLVGSAIMRRLRAEGFENIVTRSHAELDLTNQEQVDAFFAQEKPEYVFLAAAKVGGIMANKTYPAEFIYKNLMIGCNVVEASYRQRGQKTVESWFFVHLSAAGAAADEGRRFVDFGTGSDQRGLCDCQDCGN